MLNFFPLYVIMINILYIVINSLRELGKIGHFKICFIKRTSQNKLEHKSFTKSDFLNRTSHPIIRDSVYVLYRDVSCDQYMAIYLCRIEHFRVA